MYVTILAENLNKTTFGILFKLIFTFGLNLLKSAIKPNYIVLVLFYFTHFEICMSIHIGRMYILGCV